MQGARRKGAAAATDARALSGKGPPALPRHRRARRGQGTRFCSAEQAPAASLYQPVKGPHAATLAGWRGRLVPTCAQQARSTRTQGLRNTVRTSCTYQPPACCTYRRHRAACPRPGGHCCTIRTRRRRTTLGPTRKPRRTVWHPRQQGVLAHARGRLHKPRAGHVACRALSLPHVGCYNSIV